MCVNPGCKCVYIIYYVYSILLEYGRLYLLMYDMLLISISVSVSEH